MKSEPVKSVVITGASTGIGRACALHMDRLGWCVFAGVRRDADAASLRAEASDRLLPITLDVTDASTIHSAEQVVEKSLGGRGLSGLVNNAGIPYGGPVEFLDLDRMRQAFEVNFFGLIAVAQAFLPLLRVGPGRIVNMSSISGMIASPFITPYTCSKFAMEALTDSLRVELNPWHIHVAVIQPGAIDTPIWNKAGDVVQDVVANAPQAGLELYGPVMEHVRGGFVPHGISTDAVARAVAHALTSRHPRTRYPVGTDAAVVRLLRLLPDRWRDRLMLARLPNWG